MNNDKNFEKIVELLFGLEGGYISSFETAGSCLLSLFFLVKNCKCKFCNFNIYSKHTKQSEVLDKNIDKSGFLPSVIVHSNTLPNLPSHYRFVNNYRGDPSLL